MKKLKKGFFVTFEGIDGSGKSTLSHLVYQELQKTYQSILTKEPGGTALGKVLRESLLHTDTVAPRAEFLLFAADRAQHFYEIVIPALRDGMVVISDRCADSSLVYQGYGRGIDTAWIQAVNQWAMESYEPDLVCYVKVPVEIAYERIALRKAPRDTFEQINFMKKLAEGFDLLVASKQNVVVVDGTQDPESLAAEICTLIKEKVIQQ